MTSLDTTDLMWLSLIVGLIVFAGLTLYHLLCPKPHPRDQHRPWDKLEDR